MAAKDRRTPFFSSFLLYNKQQQKKQSILTGIRKQKLRDYKPIPLTLKKPFSQGTQQGRHFLFLGRGVFFLDFGFLSSHRGCVRFFDKALDD